MTKINYKVTVIDSNLILDGRLAPNWQDCKANFCLNLISIAFTCRFRIFEIKESIVSFEKLSWQNFSRP